MDLRPPCQYGRVIGYLLTVGKRQARRRSGVPPALDGSSYAHVAHIPPRSVADGSASFVLRGWDPTRWRSNAEGRWLLDANEGDQLVTPGTVVIITEGLRPVASFRVDHVLPD